MVEVEDLNIVPDNETAEAKTLRLLTLSLSRLIVPNAVSLPVKIQKQTHFFGNGQDKANVMLWLNSIVVNMDYCEVPIDKRVKCASSHLNDAALTVFTDWINTAPLASQKDWNAFSVMMKNRFLPLDHVVNVRDQMVTIKQTTTVAAYNLAFDKLLSQIPPDDRDSEGLLVTLYIKGLQTNVRENIRYILLPTVKENMARALLYDSSHPSLRQANNSANLANSYFDNKSIKKNKSDDKKESTTILR